MFNFNESRSHLLLLLLLGSSLLLCTFAQESIPADGDGDGDDDDLKVEDLPLDESGEPASAETIEPSISYESPNYEPDKFHFVDHFDDVEASKKRWVRSTAKKDGIDENIAKYDGVWQWEAPQRIVSDKDKGLVLKSKAKHAAIAARLSKPFTFQDFKPLVVQYEVTLQEGQECGGSYIKLLSSGKHLDDLKSFHDKTPYTIMFGPDKCGNDIKLHFIFRHVNPLNGTISEKHCKKPKDRLEEPFKDKLPHLYKLIVGPDNTYEISVDHNVVNSGSLLEDFTPPVNPPREIDDPNDTKPADWDEREKIPNPEDKKPDDWDDDAPPQIPDPDEKKPENWLEDEPEMIPDESAVKPVDWDDAIDGEWEQPLVENPVCKTVAGCGKWKAKLVPNPNYKGVWRPQLIDNPAYNGKWAPRKIPNPGYFEDLEPFRMTPIEAIGIELWAMSNNILFDNLIITDDVDLAKEFAAQSFDVKRSYIEKESESFASKLLNTCKQNPAIWIGLFIAFIVVLVLMYKICFAGKKDQEEEANAKKTDKIQPDDVVLSQESEVSQVDDIADPTETPNEAVTAQNNSADDDEIETDSEKENEEITKEKAKDAEETNDESKNAATTRKRAVRKD